MNPTATTDFSPSNLDCSDFAQLEPLYQQLLDRPIESADELMHWLTDLSQLQAAISEYGSRCNIDHSCHTDDQDIEKTYMHWVEKVQPKIKPFGFEISKKYLACGFADQLEPDRFAVMTQEWQSSVEIYRDKNVPLQTKVTQIVTEYDKLNGKMVIEFRGEKYTLQQLARFIEEPDRATRYEAWELISKRRLEDRESIDEIYDRLLALRAEIATNAGFENYREYLWKNNCRFDYTPQDCHQFADAIEKTCVPVVDQLNRDRREQLGVDTLKPWDLSVDIKGRDPLRPFDPEHVDEMVTKVRQVFDRLSPSLGEQFGELKQGRNLDLESRIGKRAGGYQASLEQSREPFIFMNAAGLHRDVETLLHEGGHAFHYMAARDEPLVFLRHAPLEFCEVASMSMELLALDHMSVFYDDADTARAVRAQLEGILRIMPWIATIDQFQHWIYTNANHTAADRTAAWLDIFGRFHGDAVDWTGHEDARAARWHAQLHLFHYPFYYIEYGIAQLGALQVWMNFRQDADKALADLRKAFAMGGKPTLPLLFETSGTRFDFSYDTIAPLVEHIRNMLAKLGS